MKFEESHLAKPAINLVPILDSIFILVFVFMFGLLGVTKKQGLKLNLPTASQSRQIQIPQEILIEITAGQEVIFQNKNTNLKNLGRELELLSLEASHKAILIKGDRQAPLGSTIQILDLVKKHGFSNVTIETANK